MKTIKKTITLITLLSIAPLVSHAAIINTGITGYTSFVSDTSEYNNTVIGNNITVGSSDIYITGLGYIDVGLNGLSTTHEVGIFDLAGNLLTSAIVPSGTTGTLVDNFRYIELDTAQQLSASTTYRIATYDAPTTDGDTFLYSVSGLTSGTGVTVSDYFYENATGGLTFPTGGNSTLRVLSNFQYSLTPVPEPAHFATILALVACGITAKRRTRR